MRTTIPKWKAAGRARPGGKRKRDKGPQEVELLQRLGQRIKQLRIKRGITGAELGAIVGVCQAIQFSRESGNVGMPVEELSRYAKALGCKPADLVK